MESIEIPNQIPDLNRNKISVIYFRYFNKNLLSNVQILFFFVPLISKPTIHFTDGLVRNDIYFVAEEIHFGTNYFSFVISEIKMFTNEINFLSHMK